MKFRLLFLLVLFLASVSLGSMVQYDDLTFDVLSYSGPDMALNFKLGYAEYTWVVVFVDLGLIWARHHYEYQAYSCEKKTRFSDKIPWFLFGLGALFYPVDNKESLFYDGFVGVSVGGGERGRRTTGEGISERETYANIVIRLKVEVGKSWAFSESSTLGFSLHVAFDLDANGDVAFTDHEFGYVLGANVIFGFNFG